MIFIIAYSLSLLTAAFLGWVYWKKHSELSWEVRITPGLVGLLWLSILAFFILKIEDARFYDHNWERLQNAFALAQGHSIYHTLNHGAILNTIYGPVSMFAYLPAACVAEPAAVMRVAASLSIAYFFLPVFLIHAWSASPGFRNQAAPGAWIRTLLAFAVFVIASSLTSALRNAAFRVHADAPALGLGALSAFFVMKCGDKKDFLKVAPGPLFAVLAIWSKQVTAPLAVALAVYLLWAEGKKSMFRFLLYFAGWGILLSGAFVYAFGLEPLYFNLIQLPSSQPMRDNWVLDSLIKLGRECLIPLVIAHFSIGLGFWKNKNDFIQTLRLKRWPVFAICGFFLF